MIASDRCCTIVPYFEVPEANQESFRRLCEQFVSRTENEPRCLYYGFSFSGNLAHCREGYEDADALLTHLEKVGDLLEEALKISTMSRLEVHGPEAELEKLRQPLAHLNPQFFSLLYGFRR
jgi:quinol monooxygenase YgiN